MATSAEHYEKHLAPVYSWMCGGIESAVARGNVELDQIGLSGKKINYAVDLGAGFGMHSIPLARNDCNVLALDSSSYLLNELAEFENSNKITTVVDDLNNFSRHLADRPDAILCMGDTITHLPEIEALVHLVDNVSKSLEKGGLFVTSFRDYTTPLLDDKRFIPVKSDEHRIFTCFLEYFETSIEVHDILHEKTGEGWEMHVSSYRKLRIDPEWLGKLLADGDFTVSQQNGLNGMVRFCATRN